MGNSTTTNRILTIDPHTGLARQWNTFQYQANPAWLYSTRAFDSGQSTRQDTMRKLFDVLTDAQKQTLLEWVGEPYNSATWQMLHKKPK